MFASSKTTGIISWESKIVDSASVAVFIDTAIGADGNKGCAIRGSWLAIAIKPHDYQEHE